MWKAGIRKDDKIVIGKTNIRMNRRNFRFVTTGFKTEVKAVAYTRNLNYPDIEHIHK